jgi:diacylglycerol kinase family enzyme
VKVSVFVNGQAGRANFEAIQNACDRALFRTELQYFQPDSKESLQNEVLRQADQSDAMVICGGDGTLNYAVQPLLMAYRNGQATNSEFRIPPILPLPVGTANDLASELRITDRLEKAARRIMESEPSAIDVLEVKSSKGLVYMLTNGGLGLAAETADLANHVRENVYAGDKNKPSQSLSLSLNIKRFSKEAIRLTGSRIYELLLAKELLSGNSAKWLRGWCVSIEIDGGLNRDTSAPFIMVNNQARLGGKYIPAPLTSNTDGTFNILLVESIGFLALGKSLWQIRNGQVPDEEQCPRLETSHAIFRSKGDSRDLTFFGDGEILHRGVREIEVTCLKRALPVFLGSEDAS